MEHLAVPIGKIKLQKLMINILNLCSNTCKGRLEMSAIFGETLGFSQENGPEVRLRVYGDEFYARYETEDGYTAIYDESLGKFTYALLKNGSFVSSGVDVSQKPP